MPVVEGQGLPDESRFGHVLSAAAKTLGAGDAMKADAAVLGDSIADILADSDKFEKLSHLFLVVTIVFIITFSSCLLVCFYCGVFEEHKVASRTKDEKKLATKTVLKKDE